MDKWDWETSYFYCTDHFVVLQLSSNNNNAIRVLKKRHAPQPFLNTGVCFLNLINKESINMSEYLGEEVPRIRFAEQSGNDQLRSEPRS